ncbi:MAG TPA: SPOR domain-containing protein [Vicinamibacterales bacterium]|nr:SPOR domain-containing protein [Vicinamibacterales bacterium]
MAAHTDDGFHEIQLNGKQLVFLFMAATVVSVVIFLCGVLVGRGVRDQQVVSQEAVQLSAAAEPVARPAATVGAPAQTVSDPTAASAPPPADEFSYNGLDKANPPAEKLKSPEQLRAQEAKIAAAPKPVESKISEPAKPIASPKAAERPAAVASSVADKPPVERVPAPAAAKPAPASATTAPAAGATGEPLGTGYAVQIAALNVRSEADAIARRLTSKGYAAYVMTPASGTPQVYRVRIGKFGSRREAETIATKLEKEEQFKPWITR